MKILPQLLIGGLLFGAGLIGISFAAENRGAEMILMQDAIEYPNSLPGDEIPPSS